MQNILDSTLIHVPRGVKYQLTLKYRSTKCVLYHTSLPAPLAEWHKLAQSINQADLSSPLKKS